MSTKGHPAAGVLTGSGSRASFTNHPMSTIIDHELLLAGGRYRLLYTEVDGKVAPTEMQDGGKFWFTPSGAFAQLLIQELHDMTVRSRAREDDALENGFAISACERVMDAIAGHTDWHPDPSVDVDNWNEEAHIEVTLTVGDCRAIKKALAAAGKLERFTKDWGKNKL